MKTLSSHYRVLSCIPNVKSWGWLPEHEELTLEQARKVRDRFRSFNMQTRIIRTSETLIEEKLHRRKRQ
jgi:hypothetical protein